MKHESYFMRITRAFTVIPGLIKRKWSWASPMVTSQVKYLSTPLCSMVVAKGVKVRTMP
jgi:hypothetical protein